jgi:FKBP-type peptidyl-prolyl cis-trans isomerase FklB
MPVGSKWQLFVPSDLAYGERAPGGTIGPNSTLIFEVELISIQPKDTKQGTTPATTPTP